MLISLFNFGEPIGGKTMSVGDACNDEPPRISIELFTRRYQTRPGNVPWEYAMLSRLSPVSSGLKLTLCRLEAVLWFRV